MTIDQYLQTIADKRVAVIGAGVSNLPLVRLLREAAIDVTVHDKKDAAALGEIYDTLTALGVSTVLGEHYLDALDEDVIFRTPGLHPRFLEHARVRGAQITSEMELFFAVCPCRIIGITGSDGKTTTTTLVCEILKHAGHICHLGGNIGAPLLPQVRDMQSTDLAIVELSSFQLMGMQYSPSIAAITNLSPNHLDYHADFNEYVQAKTSVFAHQDEGDRLILNYDDEVSRTLSLNQSSEVAYCSKCTMVQNGVFLKDGILYAASHGMARALLRADEIRIPGAHNVSNVMMAAAICEGLCSDEDIRAVAREFPGVPHRIELVREKNGVRYYNDSIASSPTRTIAGLNSFGQKVILIAGGYDKHIPYDVLGLPICEHVKTLILTGATAPKIRDCVAQADTAEKPTLYDAVDLADAVRQAATLAHTGDVVIMSPASASFDCFKNFVERGETFKALVNAL